MTNITDPRLRGIRRQLIRGDVNRIAEQAGVSRFWATRVLRGQQKSERVLETAEKLIACRNEGAENDGKKS